MGNLYLDVELLGKMLGQVLCAVKAAVLAACAAEANLQMCKLALYEPLNMNIYKTVNVVKEEEDFSVVLKEFDHLFVHAVELTIVLVLAGVVNGTTVKDITAAVAAGIYGDTLLVSKTVNANFQALVFCNLVELLHAGKLCKYLIHIRILVKRLTQQAAQVVNSKGNAGQEVRLLFKVAPETVGAQGLKVAEQHELAQLLTEMSLVKIWQESPYGTEIGRQHVFLQVFGVTGTGLPNERCNIVVDRALAAALEVYEVRGGPERLSGDRKALLRDAPR